MSLLKYRKQVQLLLDVLPEVAAEECFALHGGTAINLFVRDMPRLSVDLDLTYLPIEDRETTLSNIARALEAVQARMRARQPTIRVTGTLTDPNFSVRVRMHKSRSRSTQLCVAHLANQRR